LTLLSNLPGAIAVLRFEPLPDPFTLKLPGIDLKEKNCHSKNNIFMRIDFVGK